MKEYKVYYELQTVYGERKYGIISALARSKEDVQRHMDFLFGDDPEIIKFKCDIVEKVQNI